MNARTDRTEHPVANAIGAMFRGAREGDEQIRKRGREWIRLMLGGGFAVYIAIRLVSLVEAEVRQGWQVDAAQRASLVAAVKEQTDGIRDQTKALTALVEEIRSDRAKRDQDHAVMLDRLNNGRHK